MMYSTERLFSPKWIIVRGSSILYLMGFIDVERIQMV